MIIGNPNKFAVFLDRIECWNTNHEDENSFCVFFINGKIIPNYAENSIHSIVLSNIISFLENIPENPNVFEMKSNDAVKALYNFYNPRDWEQNVDIDADYRYVLDCSELIDNNYFIFGVKNGTEIRLLSVRPEYDREESVHILDTVECSEIIFSKDEVSDLINKLKNNINIKSEKIIGNPYKFAIVRDIVPEWDNFENNNQGFVGLSVYGVVYPDYSVQTDIRKCLLKLTDSLKKIKYNEDIVNMDTVNAYRTLYNEVYPEDETKKSDVGYLVSALNEPDKKNNVFIVKGNDKIRILSSGFMLNEAIQRFTEDEEAIQDVVLEEGEFEDILCRIEKS